MANRIVVDPVTRIEGHLRIEAEIKDGKVVDAYSSGTMVRGIEIILKGRPHTVIGVIKNTKHPINLAGVDLDHAVYTSLDNGKSFSQEMLHRAFEPYMTDKPTGTGLGLPVVKKIIEEHGGRISLNNLADGGACVKISLPEF